jgi:hypothetical protein
MKAVNIKMNKSDIELIYFLILAKCMRNKQDLINEIVFYTKITDGILIG